MIQQLLDEITDKYQEILDQFEGNLKYGRSNKSIEPWKEEKNYLWNVRGRLDSYWINGKAGNYFELGVFNSYPKDLLQQDLTKTEYFVAPTRLEHLIWHADETLNYTDNIFTSKDGQFKLIKGFVKAIIVPSDKEIKINES